MFIIECGECGTEGKVELSPDSNLLDIKGNIVIMHTIHDHEVIKCNYCGHIVSGGV